MKYTKLIALASICLFCSSLKAFPQEPTDKYLHQDIPQAWQVTQRARQTLPNDDAWWRTFGDSTLNYLIDRAVTHNYDVAAALKRIELSRKMIQEVQAGYFPTINLSGGWTKDQQSGAIVKPAVAGSSSSYFSLGATMNWEIDVFGRVAAQAKAKKASYNASRADYEAVMVSLCANVATYYMTLRMCQDELAVADAHIQSQEKVMKITEARFEAELADMLDVTQSKIVLYGTQSSLPGLHAQIKTIINSLAVLTGEKPEDLAQRLDKFGTLPEYGMDVAAGVPSDLLRRRPDIVEAEMQLEEYAANIGIAKKDFLPALSLTGTIGTSAHDVDGLFGDHSLTWSVAPQLSWTLFDGLARNYRTAEAKLQFEAALDQYNLTVMNAISEVDNALIDYDSALQSIELQKKVVEESEKSLHLAVDLYKTGLTAFSNVVDGQMNWLESQNTLVTLKGKALTSLVAIYKALGGGWESAVKIHENQD